jgi:hypothetical protein
MVRLVMRVTIEIRGREHQPRRSGEAVRFDHAEGETERIYRILNPIGLTAVFEHDSAGPGGNTHDLVAC